MKFYAEEGPRRSRQLFVDVVVLLWCLLWIGAGIYVHSSFAGAENGAKKIGSSGSSLSSNLSDAGNFVSVVPFGGGKLKDSFDSAADAAQSMSKAGHDLSNGLGRLAFLLGFLTAIAPMLFALLPWSLIRLRYARRAGRAAQLRSMPSAEKLLALESLSQASPRTLAAITDDPAGKWQQGDADVTQRLADLALSTYGLRRNLGKGAAATKAMKGAAATKAMKGAAATPTKATAETKPVALPFVSRPVRDTEDEDTHWE